MTASAAIQYLTVQDILWTNLQITKQTNPFDFAKLEEATFLQYGYGTSQDVLAQAAKFLKGYPAKAPFGGKAEGETAFIATIAFLAINGYALPIPASESRAWLDRVTSGQVDAAGAISQLAQMEESHGHSPQEALQYALDTYGPSIIRSS